MDTPELLAPAGSPAALHAAVAAGADAVYLGLGAFNARRNADNFTLASLADACEYAHLRGVRVYVALNTLVLPSELEEACALAGQAHRAGADAFIVQDLGLVRALRRTLPEAALHASTQMSIHNAAGIRAAAALGICRVTLARELSLEEIADLAAAGRSCGVEVEAFAHGALCVSYSGQCLMSSMIGGRSANRGVCAQACRLPYELVCEGSVAKGPGEHLLSPADLCSIDLLEELTAVGAASLKLEGRMKTPEYVGTVTSIYRRVLDDLARTGSARATQAERSALASAFSRGFTTAYLEGERGNAMMSYQRPNNRGAFVGRVREVRDGVAHLALEQPLRAGDLIEFWTRKGHERLTVADPVPVGGEATVRLGAKARGVRRQDRVFRVRSAAAAFSDDGCEPRVPVTGSVRLRLGQPVQVGFALAGATGCAGTGNAIIRRLRAAAPGASLDVMVESAPAEPARTKSVTTEEVREHIDRLGQTPFSLVDLAIDLDEGVGIGFSQLHRLRSDALEQLAVIMRTAFSAAASADALGSTPDGDAVPVRPVPIEVEAVPSVAVLATNPDCARAAKRAGATAIYVPAINYLRGQACHGGVAVPEAGQAGYPKHCRLIMPEVDHDAVGKSREAIIGMDLWESASQHAPIVVEGIGAVRRAQEEGIPFEAGPHLPLMNAQALHWAFQAGASLVWLSPELNLGQIRSLGATSPIPLGLAVAGRQMLMTMEHCALMSQGPCDQQCAICRRRQRRHALRDRKGFEFPVVTDALGRSRIYNSVPLDAVGAMGELLEAGVSTFLVDTTLMTAEEAAQATGRAVHALEAALAGKAPEPKLPKATTGHLFRGIS